MAKTETQKSHTQADGARLFEEDRARWMADPENRRIYEQEAAKKEQLLKQAAGALAEIDIPGWESSAAAARWVRRSRERDKQRLVRLQKAQ